MPHSLRSAALVVVALLLMGAPFLWSGRDSAGTTETAAPQTTQAVTSTSTTIDLSPLVASGTFDMMEELDLIEEINSQIDSTTTTPPPDTTTTTTAETSSPSAPSPTTRSTTTTTPTTTTTASSTSTTPPPTTTTTKAGGYHSGAEGDFASRINSYRGSNGESSLSRDSSLDSHARSWAKKMADSGQISHSNIGSLLPPWSAAGENVGTGSSVSAIFDALVSSSGHRANMLDDYTHLGVGVYQDANGQLWTSHVFAR